jgi:protein gp37
MGEKTAIAWTDHTFNPWIGCQKVSEGCRNCYAERQNNDRFHWVKEWGKDYWRTSEANWKKPIQWARQAVKDGVVKRVFCASLADVFDPNVSEQWRIDLWDLILDTEEIGGLEWLLLTKRPENISKMFEDMMQVTNVRMGVTAEKQEMADKRIPILQDSWEGKNFISVEPMLSNIDLSKHQPFCRKFGGFRSARGILKPAIDWVICGAESGPNARPMDIEWARSVRDQCQDAGVPFFLKQMVVDGKLVHMPELDGKVWDQFPEDA